MYVLASREGLLGSSDLYRAVEWLSDRAWLIDGVRSVESLATFPHVFMQDENLEIRGSLEYACGQNTCDPGKTAEVLPDFLLARLASRDLRAAAVIAKVDLGDHSSRGVLAIASDAKAIQEQVRIEFPGVDVFLTGGVPMMEAFFSAAARDSSILMPVVLLLIFAVTGLFLGSFMQAFLLALMGLGSVIITMGVAGWFGHTLNTATATAPLIIFTLVVASSMHLFMHVSIGQSELGIVGSLTGRVKAAVRSNVVPIVLTTLTTAFGFASMFFVSSPPLRQLGGLASLGVIIGAFPLLDSYAGAICQCSEINFVQAFY
jgi:uncharacterized protein